ncbi:hypothetical protein FS842_008911 [Serendipita sp. 407]|nr:hypothetical protein FS842_008911 [Serendipita sp. 407]
MDKVVEDHTNTPSNASISGRKRKFQGSQPEIVEMARSKRTKKSESPDETRTSIQSDDVKELLSYPNVIVDPDSSWAQRHRIENLPGADIYYQKDFIDEDTANSWYEQLTQLETWYRPTLSMYGKPYVQSRSIASYVTSPNLTARYSGHSVEMNHPYPALLIEIQNRVSAVLNVGFDHVMLNWYQDGSVHIGKHRDTKENQVIASLSLGSQRTFILHPHVSKGEKKVDAEPKRWPLKNGSLLVMQGDTQENWKVLNFNIPRDSVFDPSTA